jgi:hypothetical protein
MKDLTSSSSAGVPSCPIPKINMALQKYEKNSAADPDPYAFGPPGSGSFYHQAKIVRKTSIPTVL